MISLLAHADWRVRLEAQFELVRKNVAPSLLYQVANQGNTESYDRLHATWALGQLVSKNEKAAPFILSLALTNSPEVRAQATKLIGDHQLAEGYGLLMAALDDKAYRVKYFAAQSLGKPGKSSSADALVDLLLMNKDRDVILRHSHTLCLC